MVISKIINLVYICKIDPIKVELNLNKKIKKNILDFFFSNQL